MTAALQVMPIEMPRKQVIDETYKELVCDEPKKHWISFIPYESNGVRIKYGRQSFKSIAGNGKVSHHLLQMQGSNKLEKVTELDGNI